MKKWFWWLFLFLMFSGRVWAESSVYFEPVTIETRVNNNFSLKVKLNPSGNQVTAVALYLLFDAQKLKLETITPSSAFNVVLQSAKIDNSSGNASIVLGVPPTAPVSNPAEIVSLVFVPKTTGQAWISISQQTEAVAINQNGNVITSYGSDANVAISGPSSSPPPAFFVIPSPSLIFSPIPTIKPSFSPLPRFSAPPPSGQLKASVSLRPSPLPQETPAQELFPRLKEYLKRNPALSESTNEKVERKTINPLEFLRKVYSVISSWVGRVWERLFFWRKD